MEESTEVCINIRSNISDWNNLAKPIEDLSPTKISSYLEKKDSSSEEDEVPQHRIRKRIQQFSDSDVEKENLNSTSFNNNDDEYGKSDKESEDVFDSLKKGFAKSRIQIGEDSSDSDASENHEATNEQKIRLNNKRIKMKQKFKGLLSSRNKSATIKNKNEIGSGNECDYSSSESEILSTTNKIKQKMKKSMTTIPSICDPDTSDEENTSNKQNIQVLSKKDKQRQKQAQKSIKMTDAKPMKISAKQAMENMQLIKSESNRLLREKDVSLPYHRPKALSLKDVLSKRKPAISSDGKVLPIKMNDEQLKQYALQLEQRQKEMMELCKSESDEDIVENSEDGLLNVKSENIGSQSNIENLSSTEEKGSDVIHNTEIKETSMGEKDSENNLPYKIDLQKITCTTDEQNRNESIDSLNSQNNSNTDMRLVYNDDSLEEENIVLDNNQNATNANVVAENTENETQRQILETHSEQESQSMHLNYTETNTEGSPKDIINSEQIGNPNTSVHIDTMDDRECDFLSDDDINMDDINKIIENSITMKDEENEVNFLKTIKNPLNMKPRLIGVPGMVINLDDAEPTPKRSGMELLKEKFAYFSKLKTPDELEREREKKLKPGAQHLKLKQELEDKIAEQRSLEWAKRLEDEKQRHEELDAILDDADDDDISTEKIESTLNKPDLQEESNSESEEELVEDDIEITDKAHKLNPMIDDEAEESDIDESEQDNDLKQVDQNEEDNEDPEECVEEDNEDSSDSSESSESEDENQTSKARKGRILKAFEDSDDEDIATKQDKSEIVKDLSNKSEIEVVDGNCKETNITESNDKCKVLDPLDDDVIQLAQKHASVSEDLFASQENSTPNESDKFGDERSDEDLVTQTFSISTTKPNNFLCPSQPFEDPNIKVIAEGFTQNLLGSQLPGTQSSQSQAIGEDILALCTGKFYDNEFITQSNENEIIELASQDVNRDKSLLHNSMDRVEATSNIKEDIVRTPTHDNISIINNEHLSKNNKGDEISDKRNNDGGHILKSILDELDNPEFDKPKSNKFFIGGQNKNDLVDNSQIKKRLIIDSDDEINESSVVTKIKKKKLKKKKLEARVLQISDDEDEEDEELELEEDYDSDLELETERVVEYDSEENEIEVKPDKPKKKRQTTDFFEQEAELTSEDEWVGSGDEDEHGLDRMEREEGDDDVFHQGKLKKELGQIHMRDVLDQDKREVRILQELLFEDGDLGGGHRQRKFRWRNADDEETGTLPGEFADTQEEFEFESEEQWRKQRHERELFLRQMQNQEDDAKLNVTVDRTSIIKANLSSKSMSMLLMEVNQSKTEAVSTPAVPEKKSVKDVPSPKKTFSILQQNYHGSLLTRGRGALARLAALATPLAVDDDAPKISSLAPHKRNFVFATVTPADNIPKVTIKRKANPNTPKLVKKMRIEEKQNNPKSSLLDHFNL